MMYDVLSSLRALLYMPYELMLIRIFSPPCHLFKSADIYIAFYGVYNLTFERLLKSPDMCGTCPPSNVTMVPFTQLA